MIASSIAANSVDSLPLAFCTEHFHHENLCIARISLHILRFDKTVPFFDQGIGGNDSRDMRAMIDIAKSVAGVDRSVRIVVLERNLVQKYTGGSDLHCFCRRPADEANSITASMSLDSIRSRLAL